MGSSRSKEDAPLITEDTETTTTCFCCRREKVVDNEIVSPFSLRKDTEDEIHALVKFEIDQTFDKYINECIDYHRKVEQNRPEPVRIEINNCLYELKNRNDVMICATASVWGDEFKKLILERAMNEIVIGKRISDFSKNSRKKKKEINELYSQVIPFIEKSVSSIVAAKNNEVHQRRASNSPIPHTPSTSTLSFRKHSPSSSVVDNVSAISDHERSIQYDRSPLLAR